MDGGAKFVFHLLVVFLALSELVRVDARPVTRTGSLMVHESRVPQHVSSGTSSVTSERANSGTEAISGRRKDIEGFFELK
ncbi:hypothetical protein CRG98_016452 [Punica granatum]|uniref:Uncharacterized protein n=1 Tax=Punica granatum TaxID=22663 RepID=A0A2I0K3Y5_PUNGR|nr:hypothetical protein CRG98_016452 [Punica granatum]